MVRGWLDSSEQFSELRSIFMKPACDVAKSTTYRYVPWVSHACEFEQSLENVILERCLIFPKRGVFVYLVTLGGDTELSVPS